MKYKNILNLFYSTDWVLDQSVYNAVESYLLHQDSMPVDTRFEANVQNGFVAEDDSIDQAYAQNSIAVIPVTGLLVDRASYVQALCGDLTTYQNLSAQIRAVGENESVKTIVLYMNTPGGMVNGISQVSDAINYAKANGKRVVTYAVSATSGGYWIASQSDKIVVSDTSSVGSIAVRAKFIDATEKEKKDGYKTTVFTTGDKKAIGDPSVPLTEENKEFIQSKLDRIHEVFVSTVVAGRPKLEGENKLFTGEVFLGIDSIELGLADEIGTFSSVITNEQSLIMADNIKTDKTDLVPVVAEELEALQSIVKEQAAQIADLQGQIKAMEGERFHSEVEAALNSAEAEGRILPATRSHWERLLVQDFASASQLLSQMDSKVTFDEVKKFEVKKGDDDIAQDDLAFKINNMLGLIDSEGKFDVELMTLEMDGNGRIIS